MATDNRSRVRLLVLGMCGNTSVDLRHRSSTATVFFENSFCTTFGVQ